MTGGEICEGVLEYAQGVRDHGKRLLCHVLTILAASLLGRIVVEEFFNKDTLSVALLTACSLCSALHGITDELT